ncbi:MAG: hypothetical protein HQK49_01895 [Oligoflexia bacterium]|nr:hypothetical protein [Oligoflexia bacterium]
MKKISVDYKFRKSSVVDRSKKFLDFLGSNPSYTNALAYRRILLHEIELRKQYNEIKVDRKKITLYTLESNLRVLS